MLLELDPKKAKQCSYRIRSPTWNLVSKHHTAISYWSFPCLTKCHHDKSMIITRSAFGIGMLIWGTTFRVHKRKEKRQYSNYVHPSYYQSLNSSLFHWELHPMEESESENNHWIDCGNYTLFEIELKSTKMNTLNIMLFITVIKDSYCNHQSIMFTLYLLSFSQCLNHKFSNHKVTTYQLY